MDALTTGGTNAPQPLAGKRPASNLRFGNMDELTSFAKLAFGAGHGGGGRWESVAMILATGDALGLHPAQSLNSIYATNGKCSLYGDMPLALVRASGHFESMDERMQTDGAHCIAFCTVTRKGEKPVTRSYSTDDAKLAGLLAKKGPWQTKPKRMLQFKARAWVLNDVFPDVLLGLLLEDDDDGIAPQPTDRPNPAPGVSGGQDSPKHGPSRGNGGPESQQAIAAAGTAAGGADGTVRGSETGSVKSREPSPLATPPAAGVVVASVPVTAKAVLASHAPAPITQDTIDTLKGLRDPWFRARGASPDEPMSEIVARLWTPMLNGDYFVLKATDLNDADGKHLAARMTIDIDGAALLASQSPDV